MALLTGSPAVNLIPPGTSGCGSTIAADQRGVSRPVGTGCDVGAYEDASAPTQLKYLLAMVTGVGPGTSFADKVKQIQGYVAAKNTTSACTSLNTFIAQVTAQIGKKLNAAQAAPLNTEARSIKTLLGC